MSRKIQRQEFIRQQADAYSDYARKEGAGDFEFWAESKGLNFEDTKAIAKLLAEILNELKTIRDVSRVWMTVDQTADYLGLKVNTVYQYVNQKRIPFRKIPGSSKLIFSKKDIDLWIQNNGQAEISDQEIKNKVDRILGQLV